MENQMQKTRKQTEAAQRAENSERAAGVFMQMLGLVPDEESQNALLGLIMDETRLTEPDRIRGEILTLMAPLDLESNRSEIVRLLLELIPVDQLVPTVYEKYRPMVADAANVILSKLSAERLRTKLVEQLMLPFEASLAERLIELIARMPTMQKLGQIIARNRNLDPKFRKLLQKLENGIRDASYESISNCVHKELKQQIDTHKIKLSNRFLAEASVCAVVPFTYRTEEGEKQKGVFKVLKPFVARYWAEELKILNALAHYLDKNRARYGLPTLGFREVLKEVRELLKREVKLRIEQGRLQDAQNFYSQDSNVRIPRLLPLQTEIVTGMEYLEGQKVTIAAQRHPENRRHIAELVLDKLILSVLFHKKEDALFHADPHAGNIFYSLEDDELVIFDWGLSCTLKRAIRGQIVQLILGFIINDRKRAYKAACNLTEGKLNKAQTAIVERKVDEIFAGLPSFPMVRLEPLTKLLDDLILDGIRFPAELLMFRKSLFTLIGVLHDVDETFDMDWHLTRSLLEQVIREVPSRLIHSPWSSNYPSQITTMDLRDVIVRLAPVAAKAGMELTPLLSEFGLGRATSVLERFSFGFKRPVKHEA